MRDWKALLLLGLPLAAACGDKGIEEEEEETQVEDTDIEDDTGTTQVSYGTTHFDESSLLSM